MKKHLQKYLRGISVLILLVAITATALFGMAYGQAAGTGAPPAAPEAKKPVQGYTRIHPKTGQPVAVRPYKRRPPLPKAVAVQPYTRGGLPVAGHQRRKPSGGAKAAPAGQPKAQSRLPLAWRWGGRMA